MSKHTAGPWFVNDSTKNGFEVWADIGAGQFRVAVTGHAYTFDKANADLIAAAPELLAELEKLSERINNIYGAGFDTVTARAAIAKAKGES